MPEAPCRAHPCESVYKNQYINSPLHERAKSMQSTWRGQNSVARWRHMNSESSPSHRLNDSQPTANNRSRVREHSGVASQSSALPISNESGYSRDSATRTGSRVTPFVAKSGDMSLPKTSDQREWTTSIRAEARTGSRAMPLLGRDELNLIDFPIGTLSYKQPKNEDGSRPDELVFSVETFDHQQGKIIPKKLTTRTSSKYGFPTPKEEQLLVGLLLLTRMKNNFSQPRVEFRSGELFALMNWPHNSSSKRQLQTGLDRLSTASRLPSKRHCSEFLWQ